MIKTLSIAEVEYTAFRLAKELMTYNEPIPDFTTRFPNILESCLMVPFQEFGRKPFYKGVENLLKPILGQILIILSYKNYLRI